MELSPAAARVSLATIVHEWGRIGCIGFGGPPAHIRLLRDLWVERRKWLDAQEFEDAIAVCNLLPGPASTQLAIFCAWRLRGPRGALVGGACFIVPGLIVILVLSAVFLAPHPPLWISGAAHGFMIEHATTFNRILLEFLGRAEKAHHDRTTAPV